MICYSYTSRSEIENDMFKSITTDHVGVELNQPDLHFRLRHLMSIEPDA